MYRNTYVEIDNSIIEANARYMCENFPHKYNIAVVKGNAYGHGYGVVPAMIKGGMNAFAVSKLEEAVEVRMGQKEYPVIMLQPVLPKYLNVCADYDISVCVNDKETFEDIEKSGLSLKLQFKVDSGMNRLGFKDKDELTDCVNRTFQNEKLTVEGVFTHFHTNGLEDLEYEKNEARFRELTADIDLTKIPMVHVDRTQTVFLHDCPSYANGARIGVSLYGFSTIYPYADNIKGRIRKLQREIKNKRSGVKPTKPLQYYEVKQAFKLMTEVIQVKDVNPGEYVGYGMFHRAEGNEKIAVIDIGYADGINRKRYRTNVAINGKKYPIIGEVGMGMCEVLVDKDVKKYDKVTVLGGDIPISSITRHVGTTMYELLTNIDSSIPRFYI